MLAALALLAAVVQPVASAPQLLIPAAGNTPGVNGTFFHSDISIANFNDREQVVRVQWLPQGASSTVSMNITIQRLGFTHSSDFVSEVLNQSGVGAILLTGVTSSGDLDPTAALYAQSQIWTPSDGGTNSESFPVIPTSTIDAQTASLFFPKPARQGDFRHNIGLVNLDTKNAQTIAINLVTPIPIAITVLVPPMGMQVVPMGSPSPFPELGIVNQTPSATKSNAWVAWGSTIDNVTGDAWSELALANAPQLIFPMPIGK